MKNPNGYGTVKKLSGNRRRPWAVYIPDGYEMGVKKRSIAFLKDALTPELYEQVETAYNAYIAKHKKAKPKQRPIGYYENQADALMALAEYNRNPYDLDARNITFSQVYELFKAEKIDKMKQSAKTGYTNSYAKCEPLYNMRMNEIVSTHLQNVVNQYSDKSKSTQNNLLKLFHGMFKFADMNNIIEKDYSKYVEITSEKEAKEKVPFSREEVQKIWDNVDWIYNATGGKKSLIDGAKLMDSVLIMLYTGMRISELLDLKAEDIHLEERWMDLRGTKTPSARRIIPIHRKIMPLIENRLAEAPTGHIFTDIKGNKIKHGSYATSFMEAMCNAFGLAPHTPHECRHSFATYAAASKMNQVLVMKILGHSAGSLTQDTYTHAFIEDLIEEIDKYNL